MTKTTEELIQEVGKILIELRKDPSKEAVPEVLHTLLLQIAESAKQEERERILEALIKDNPRLMLLKDSPELFISMEDVKQIINPSKDE